MMNKTVLILSFFLFANIAFARYRPVYIDKVIKEAQQISEIIIIEYKQGIDTLKYLGNIDDSLGNKNPHTIKVIKSIKYAHLNNPDSLIEISVTALPYGHGSVFWSDIATVNNKDSLYRNQKEGLWPVVGDTVLVVIDTNSTISLFAEIKNKEYVFWSPYRTSGWITIFYASSPFKLDTSLIFNRSMFNSMQDKAKKNGYEFASFYRCKIDTESFWNEYDKIQIIKQNHQLNFPDNKKK